MVNSLSLFCSFSFIMRTMSFIMSFVWLYNHRNCPLNIFALLLSSVLAMSSLFSFKPYWKTENIKPRLVLILSWCSFFGTPSCTLITPSYNCSQKTVYEWLCAVVTSEWFSNRKVPLCTKTAKVLKMNKLLCSWLHFFLSDFAKNTF